MSKHTCDTETYIVRPPAPQGDNLFSIVEAIPREDWQGRFVCRTNAELVNWQAKRLAEANHRCMNSLAKLLFDRFAKAPRQDPMTGDMLVEIDLMLTDRSDREAFNQGLQRGVALARAEIPYGIGETHEFYE